mmetsp:Transcript_7944/g.17633  ORF Transcript_7944/g.17633 Transcript_7944/m.17633 type:complete len:1009 (-) Transcript_7944:189-3215(-)
MEVLTPLASQVDSLNHFADRHRMDCEAESPAVAPHFTVADLQASQESPKGAPLVATTLLASPPLESDGIMLSAAVTQELLAGTSSEALDVQDAEDLGSRTTAATSGMSTNDTNGLDLRSGDEAGSSMAAPVLDIRDIAEGLAACGVTQLPGGLGQVPGGTDEKLLMRRAAVRQMRSDFKLRLERSRELEAEVAALDKELAGVPETLGKRLAEVEKSLEEREFVRCKAEMQAEASMAQSQRLLDEQLQQVDVMRQRLQSLKESRRNLEVDQDEGGSHQRALQDRLRQVDALKEDAAAQEQKISLLKADLRGLLDFMMRVNIEAAGGPSQKLGQEAFMPQPVVDSLKLSSHGHHIMQKLVRKYQAFMATCEPEVPGTLAPALCSSEDVKALTPATMELPTSSIEEEALLLRGRLTDEMERVAKVLSASDQGVPNRARRHRELLRVAAWGDGKALRKLISKDASSSSSSTDAGTGADPGSSLCGWTPWHAAAAHGQRSMIEVLKDVAVAGGVDALTDAMEKTTTSGWTPLGVACIQGHAEAMEALLEAKASVNVTDARGNHPLIWAVAAEDSVSGTLVRRLLEARADPSIPNGCGLTVDPQLIAQLLQIDEGDSSTAAASAAAPVAATGETTAVEGASSPDSGRPDRDAPESTSQSVVGVAERYHCISTFSKDSPEDGRTELLSSAVAALEKGLRDTAGVRDNASAMEALSLSDREQEEALWSSVVLHYTHAGLDRVFSDASVESAPLAVEQHQQVAVVTCERLLLIHATSKTVSQAVRLADITEIVLSSFSDHMIVLRSRSSPDLALDVVMRESLLEGVRAATAALAAQWGGAEFEQKSVPIESTEDPLLPLHDGQRNRLGTIAWLQTNMMLLLPYQPQSMLLSPGTLTFGFLDLAKLQPNEETETIQTWSVCFFILKAASGLDGRLHWCSHPNDEQSLGSVGVGAIRSMAASPSEEEHRFRIDAESSTAEEPASDVPVEKQILLLRAKTAQSRDDWLASLRALQGAPDT